MAKKSETRKTANKIQTHERFKRTQLIMTKHYMDIFVCGYCLLDVFILLGVLVKFNLKSSTMQKFNLINLIKNI